MDFFTHCIPQMVSPQILGYIALGIVGICAVGGIYIGIGSAISKMTSDNAIDAMRNRQDDPNYHLNSLDHLNKDSEDAPVDQTESDHEEPTADLPSWYVNLVDEQHTGESDQRENLLNRRLLNLQMRLPGVNRRLLNASAMSCIPTENPVTEPEASITETEAGSRIIGALSGAVIYLGCVLRRFFNKK